ncbi:MAG TPA: hypothetical protein DCZ71_02835, partial [Ruminococcus sp.]|nr:hypothetical protein [Ruminococcus sp.]
MKFSLKKRIASFLTASAMTVTSMSLSPFIGVGEAKAAGFDLASSDLQINEYGATIPVNELYAKVNFKQQTSKIQNGETVNTVKPVDVTLPDNTYYLLVHAAGDEWDSSNPGSTKAVEYYQLLELEATEGDTWTSPKFDLYQTQMGEFPPNITSVEGKFITNPDPSTELDVEDAKTLSEKDGIGCMKLTGGDSISSKTEGGYKNPFGNSWEDNHNNTIEFDAT